MDIQGGPKIRTVLKVDKTATVRGRFKVCHKAYVKSFQILSRKKYKTKMSMKLNIICVVCINIQTSYVYFCLVYFTPNFCD